MKLNQWVRNSPGQLTEVSQEPGSHETGAVITQFRCTVSSTPQETRVAGAHTRVNSTSGQARCTEARGAGKQNETLRTRIFLRLLRVALLLHGVNKMLEDKKHDAIL